MEVLIPETKNAQVSVEMEMVIGTPITMLMYTSDPELTPLSSVDIELKNASDVWKKIGVLNYSNPVAVLDAPGMYRVNKPQSFQAFGVDSTYDGFVPESE